MLDLSSAADGFADYAAVQQTGKLFAAAYYGRINASAESWSVDELLTERSQYYALDTLDGRPAVGRANVRRAIDRFRDKYGRTVTGKRRIVFPLSVDTQIDEGGSAVDGHRIDRYTVFVQAEWTEEFRSDTSCADTPFVQTFRVRRLRSDGGRFEIISTVVKITGQSQKRSSYHPTKDSIHSGSEKYNETPQVKCEDVIHSNSKDQCKDTHSESEKNGYDHETPHMHFIDTTLSYSNKTLNAEALEFNLLNNDESSSSPPPTVPVNETYKLDVQVNDGYRMNTSTSELWPTQEYLDYERKVKAFLKSHAEPKKPTSSMKSSNSAKKNYYRRSGKQQKSHEYTANVETNDFQTNTVFVDGLVESTTANQLQSALTQYGPVKSVRMFSSDESGSYLPGKPVQHAAKIRFENIESVEKIMSDSQNSGFNFEGKKLRFRKSNPGRL